MDGKLIIYIIAGILYFLYSVGKKAEEKKKQAPVSTPEPELQPAKPVKAPAVSPLEEARREMQRRKALEMAKRNEALEKRQVSQPKKEPQKPKEVFIHEKQGAVFGQGAKDAPVYERTADEEKAISRDKEKEQMEAVYSIKANDGKDEGEEYVFDAREAFIGSIIFERKY